MHFGTSEEWLEVPVTVTHPTEDINSNGVIKKYETAVKCLLLFFSVEKHFELNFLYPSESDLVFFFTI